MASSPETTDILTELEQACGDPLFPAAATEIVRLRAALDEILRAVRSAPGSGQWLTLGLVEQLATEARNGKQ